MTKRKLVPELEARRRELERAFRGYPDGQVEAKAGENTSQTRLRVRGELLAINQPTKAAWTLKDLAERLTEETRHSLYGTLPTGGGARKMAEGILDGLARSTRCQICGRDLTDPKSVELGIGPDCLAKHGGPAAWVTTLLEEISPSVEEAVDNPGVSIDLVPFEDRPQPGTTWDSLEAFYFDDPRRERSAESDYGVGWLHSEQGPSWPRFRVSHVYVTGEVVAVRAGSDLGQGLPVVELLGLVEPIGAVGEIPPDTAHRALEERFQGWSRNMAEGLGWVRARLSGERVR